MRIKAMQQVVDSQASRIAALAAEKEVAALGHQDEYTGQGKEINNITTLMFSYITCKQGDDHHCQLSHFCRVSIVHTVVGQKGSGNAEGEQKFATVIQGYIKEIEELK